MADEYAVNQDVINTGKFDYDTSDFIPIVGEDGRWKYYSNEYPLLNQFATSISGPGYVRFSPEIRNKNNYLDNEYVLKKDLQPVIHPSSLIIKNYSSRVIFSNSGDQRPLYFTTSISDVYITLNNYANYIFSGENVIIMLQVKLVESFNESTHISTTIAWPNNYSTVQGAFGFLDGSALFTYQDVGTWLNLTWQGTWHGPTLYATFPVTFSNISGQSTQKTFYIEIT